MLNLTDKITNPEAIKLINDLKSGAFFVPLKTKAIRYKWFIISGGIITVLLIALSIGKTIFRGSDKPVFLPPDIGVLQPTFEKTSVSDYEWIRQNIINFGTELPDPVIPFFDNIIDLESDNIY